MNINLNLATRPYIELRSVYARLRVFAVVLAVLALPMLLVVHTEETKAQQAEARVQQLESNIALLRTQQTHARALALEGSNANVIAQAAFLNGLFRRKAFSWTATMSDLENTMPAGVQVQAIDPVVAPDGHVTIRMRVTGGRDRAVDVVHNLERSRHFIAPRVVTEALANQNNGNARGVTQISAAEAATANDVNFDILAEYRPLPNSHLRSGAEPRPAVPSHTEAQVTNPDPSLGARPTAKPSAVTRAPVDMGEPHAPRAFGQHAVPLPPPVGVR